MQCVLYALFNNQESLKLNDIVHIIFCCIKHHLRIIEVDLGKHDGGVLMEKQLPGEKGIVFQLRYCIDIYKSKRVNEK